MSDAEETAPEQRVIGRPFKPGQSGNPAGRPKGARNALGEDFIQALHEDFQTGGVDAIAKVRTEKPDAYLKVIASLLPKELKVTTESDLTDEQLDQRIRQLAAALSLELSGGETPVAGFAGGTEAPARPN